LAAQIIDGKQISQAVLAEAAAEAERLKFELGVTPGLAAVLIGDDPASQVYVRNKTRACAQVGVFAQTVELPASTTQGKAISIVEQFNRDPRYHGILVQLPLPPHMDENAVVSAINPEKDSDGLHPSSLGRLLSGNPGSIPATPAGIQQMLLRTGYDPAGKHVVVCGRSTIVGKPMALLLMAKATGANATVTVIHTGTADPGAITRQADILVVSVGRVGWLTADMVREGAVVIDVGINRIPDATRKSGSRLVGDVDFEGVSRKAAAISPVPGGVGPMTVAMLVSNTVKAARQAAEGKRVPKGKPQEWQHSPVEFKKP
jgi:methylenetetrahydrofolate dehydrogenase (NADP+)/methenyltetrahydrofolate cyclohydrolase